MRQYKRKKMVHGIRNWFVKTMAIGCVGMGVTLCSIFFSACQPGEESQMVEVVDSFSANYFNWRFHHCASYCTEESMPWLRYSASQVNETDVEVLRSMEESATCEVGEVEYMDSGDTAKVEVTVSNFLRMDTIGERARVQEKARYMVPVVLKGETWKVNLSGVLRAEKD